MISDIHQRLYDSGVMRRLASGLNRLPLPYRGMVVRVMGQSMSGHTMDRFVALWFWKLRILEYEVIGLLPRLRSPGMQEVMSRSHDLTLIIEIGEDEFAAPSCSAVSTMERIDSLGFSLAYVDTKSAKIVPMDSADAFLATLRGKQYLNLLATRNSKICWANLK